VGQVNKQKHKIPFKKMKTAFYDLSALLIHDPYHSEDEDNIDYFIKEITKKSAINYQRLINLYLADCARKKLKLNIDWKAS